MYSELPEAKVIGEPGVVGSNTGVMKGSKVYTGAIITVCSKNEVREKPPKKRSRRKKVTSNCL